jgi:hypothetical protein
MSAPELPASSTPTAGLDFGRCFTFVTEDPDWVKKVLIGGAFTLASMFLIGAFFVAGYCARVLRNVAAGAAHPLPDWDDLGGFFSEGLRLVGLYLLAVLALALVLGCPLGVIIVGLSTLRGGGRGEEVVAALGGLGIVLLYGAFAFLILLVGLLYPAAATRVVFRNDFSAGLDFAATFNFIKLNLANYLLSLVVFLVANFLSQFGFILCCVGLFPAAFWSYLTLAHGLGQTVRANPASLG